jgi:hypothetical protein
LSQQRGSRRKHPQQERGLDPPPNTHKSLIV